MLALTDLNAKTKKILKYIINLVFGLAIITITIFSLIPHPPEIYYFTDYQDKIEHFVIYTMLGSLTYFVGIQIFKTKRIRFIMPILFCLAYGFLIEVTQPYTGRNFDYLDLLANVCGGVIGTTLAYYIFIRLLQNKKKVIAPS